MFRNIFCSLPCYLNLAELMALSHFHAESLSNFNANFLREKGIVHLFSSKTAIQSMPKLNHIKIGENQKRKQPTKCTIRESPLIKIWLSTLT